MKSTNKLILITSALYCSGKNIACVFSFILIAVIMLIIILTSHYHFITMCLGNYEPVELPTFDLAVPYENHKGTCNYIETEHLDSLSPHVSDL